MKEPTEEQLREWWKERQYTKSPKYRISSGGFGLLFLLAAHMFEGTGEYLMMSICMVVSYGMISAAIKGE